VLDERLERAVHEAARTPSTDESAVAAALRTKLARRHDRRRALTGVAVATILLLGMAGGAVVIVDRDRGDDVRVTTDDPLPAPAGSPDDPDAAQQAIAETLADIQIPGLDPTVIRFVNKGQAVVTTSEYAGVRVHLVDDRWQLHPTSMCRILQGIDAADPSCARREPEVFVVTSSAFENAYDDRLAAVDRVKLEGQDYVRGPLVTVGSNVWAGTYDRDGATYTFPPSRLVAFDPDTEEVTAAVGLQGEIRSRDEDGRAGWVVTHERYIDADRVEYRVKRIDGGGGVISTPIPPGEIPVGRVAAGAGAVWVPVRDGVLVFDPETGKLQHKIVLVDQERRAVAVIAGQAYVTDVTAIREIDANRTTPGLEVAVLGTPGILADMVPAGDSVWALDVSGEVVRLDHAQWTVRARFALSQPVRQGASLHAVGSRVWVQTTVDLTPAADLDHVSLGVEDAMFLLNDHGVDRPIVLAGLVDGSATLTAEGDLVVTSGGDVYRVRLPD
jgi:hypothetical protein